MFRRALESYYSTGILNDSEYTYELETVVCDEYLDFFDAREYAEGADVLIAIGTGVVKLRKVCDLPVVQVPMSSEAFNKNIERCIEMYRPKKVAIIGHNYHEKLKRSQLAENVEVVVVNWPQDKLGSSEELRRFMKTSIDDAHAEGCEVIIAGREGCEYARSRGYNAVINDICFQDAYNAVENAIHIGYIYHKQRVMTEQYKNILDYSFDGVLSFDRDLALNVYNHSAAHMLLDSVPESDRTAKALLEQKLERMGVMSLVRNKSVYTDHFIVGKDRSFVANIIPVVSTGVFNGSVIMLQDAQRLKTIENRSHSKFYARGLTAKYRFGDITGESEAIIRAKERAAEYARSNFNILIVGETGTGKEMFAQSIHNASPRKSGPFVAINCAALSESLLESELFGYVSGAFTGAVRGGRAGYFEMADGGTIFLDEIGEISPRVQSKLLRAIQEGEIVRLGDDKITNVDVRVICATNKNLYTLAREGKFREDLYYRLDVLRIDLPPLSERTEDIPLLAKAFFESFSRENGLHVTISDEACRRLAGVPLDGNIRQLQNICMRAAIMARDGVVTVYDINQTLPRSVELGVSGKNSGPDLDAVEKAERRMLEDVLISVGGNRSEAARKLGMSRSALYRRLRQYGL